MEGSVERVNITMAEKVVWCFFLFPKVSEEAKKTLGEGDQRRWSQFSRMFPTFWALVAGKMA